MNYYFKNRDKLLDYQKKYYKLNVNKIRNYNKFYYKKNYDKIHNKRRRLDKKKKLQNTIFKIENKKIILFFN